MQVEIYVRNVEEVNAVRNLKESWKSDIPDLDLRAVDLSAVTDGMVPVQVVNRLIARGDAALPVTLVGGEARLDGRLPDVRDLKELASVHVDNEGFTACDDYVEDSVVDFPTRSRIHMNLIVKDLRRSLAFYRILFGQEPTKVREGYAKFELKDPAVNLSLLEDAHGGARPHFGIQVKSTQVIRKATKRYADAGLHLYDEGTTACCFAVQDKTWVVDPEGRQWEVYVVTDDAVDAGCEPDCICYQDLAPSLRDLEKA